jgi:7-keto-8-aminopelargonate synthetase-like enzyme
MYADFAPIEALNALAERYSQLWLYIDDAHAFSWTGRHGRGYALDRLGPAALRRSVVAGSLNKSFAAAGGAITFPDPDLHRRVFALSGPMIFSGPVQPPMLGAILASARLHLSGAVVPRQKHHTTLIRLFNSLAVERDCRWPATPRRRSAPSAPGCPKPRTTSPPGCGPPATSRGHRQLPGCGREAVRRAHHADRPPHGR